ncbi:hypothetical protein [Reichenbachiella sp. MALMAid0571]|uniref:hypothetical protein n=1 Tax=Reichenbachiella sp. MALMAid0571 TaxID=3143939 RepID=UPI0032DF47BC
MNKTAKIIIAIEAVIILFFVVFAKIRTAEAEKLKMEVIEKKIIVEEVKKEAIQLAEQAEHNAAQTRLAQNEVERVMETLQKCQSGK